MFAFGSPVAIQIYRYRRVASPAQRQQTKWVIFGLACAFLLFSFNNLAGAFVPIFSAPGSFYNLVGDSLSSLAFLLIPLSVTIAILRSRLWDIDVIIRRTLVYTTLTVILALLYFGLIFALQSLLQGMFTRITLSLLCFRLWSLLRSFSPYAIASRRLLIVASTVGSMMQPRQWLRSPEHDTTHQAPWRANPPVSSDGT